MPLNLLTNFEIQKCYQNKPKFNGICSRNYLPKIKDEAYILTLDEYESVGTRWRALYMNDDNLIYFDSFEVKYIPKEIKKIIGNKNIPTNIYGIQENDSIMFG